MQTGVRDSFWVQAKELLCVLAHLSMINDLDFLLFCVLISNGCVIIKQGKKQCRYGIAFRWVLNCCILLSAIIL